MNADLAEADRRTQNLANKIGQLYQDGHIDTDALHALISGICLIRSSIRFAQRAEASK